MEIISKFDKINNIFDCVHSLLHIILHYSKLYIVLKRFCLFQVLSFRNIRFMLKFN